MFNIAIVGGGAAGFMAAITAKQICPNAAVCIFEKGKTVLSKVAITGGGRCNLTNTFAQVTNLKQVYPRGDKLMKRLFRAFDYQDTYQWFENNGVKLTIQSDERIFPQSQTAQSVVDCLIKLARKLGVRIYTNHALVGISLQENGDIELHFKQQQPLVFNRVAITMGGTPRAEQLNFLADIGHKIEPLCPSLFTFNINDKLFTSLMGTCVERVYLSIPSTKLRSEGAFLITHWGCSGPATLKLSAYAARIINQCKDRFCIAVNWVHQTNTNVVAEKLHETAIIHAQKQLGTIAPYHLPTRLWAYLIERTGLTIQQKWSELGRKSINKLTEMLTNDIYHVLGKGKWKEEFVTCGGVSLASVKPNTLESKVCNNLFFAGEVLDVDAITGGFNLQAAWTTGHIVGENIVKE